MDKPTLKFKLVREGARIPERATGGSAAVDLRACLIEPVELLPDERAVIPTGLAAEIPSGDLVALVFARSGLSARHGISLVNGVGVIDSDYRGEIQVLMINHGDKPFVINNGERIAQLMLTYALPFETELSHELSSSERGTGGLGSTGTL